MSLEITGKYLEDLGTQKIGEKLTRREFVIETSEEINGNVYTNPVRLQLINHKATILDRFKEGDMLKVCFNIKGRCFVREEKKTYINNLEAWRVEKATVNATM